MDRLRRVPFYDLRLQHEELAAELEGVWRDTLRGGQFVLGEVVAAFERQFATFVGARHCVTVGNGTDAIEMALRASNVGSGDEVLLPANTFFATAAAVVRAGAVPVFVDVDEVHGLIDPRAVVAKLTPRSRAILPVHLYGQVAPMAALEYILEPYDIVVIEDAAQAHGATQDGSPPCTVGALACYSFYPSKNLGALGDGGAIVTRSDELADRLRLLRNYGSRSKYHHEVSGYNSRLDALQAGVLAAKLPHLLRWNAARQAAADVYVELLGDCEMVRLPFGAAGNNHVWHLYVVHVPDRDRVRHALDQSGIDTVLHYPLPLHLQPAFAHLGYQRGDFPVAERLAERLLSLPMYPGITRAEQELVCHALRKAVGC